MVAFAHHSRPAYDRRPDCVLKRFRHSPVYIYIVLMKNMPRYSREKDLETLIVLGVAFLVLFFVFRVLLLAALAAGLLVVGLASRRLSSVIAAAWPRFAKLIGDFNSRVLLSIIFYVFLTPLAVLFRIFSKNALLMDKNENSESYYQNRNHDFAKRDFEKMW